MSDTLEHLRARRRELETALVTLQARIDEIDKLLELIPKRGRPRMVASDDTGDAA